MLCCLAAAFRVFDCEPTLLSKTVRNLGNVHEAIRDAKEQKQPIEERSLAGIQSKLLKVDTATPGYWPLVFDLISYHSIIVTGLTSPPKAQAIEMSDVAVSGGPVRGGHFRLSGTIDGLRFINSWVEFDGGKSVTLKNVHFDNCVLVFVGFDFRAPNPSTQRLARDLLASNIANLVIRG